MTNSVDHYQTLGVLPSAEQVVINAAYRALAGLYHPDRCMGDKQEATRKMADINVSHSVLCDPLLRAEYDASRDKTFGRYDSFTEETDKAFDEAIQSFEVRWSTACDVFPDLNEIRKRLGKTSRKLAFGFVVQIVEKKQFKTRHQLAQAMETAFLERYFGTNHEIIEYAQSLIQWGFKDAVKKLNEFVEVLGSEVDAEPIIKRVENEFSLRNRRETVQKENLSNAAHSSALEALRKQVLYQPISNETFAYARLLGYTLDVTHGGFFKPDNFCIKATEVGPILYETASRGQMCLWIKNHLI